MIYGQRVISLEEAEYGLTLLNIQLDKIEIGIRYRGLKEHRVDVMVQDISFNGLLQPILVAERDGQFILVDGLHRLQAFKVLNRKFIDTVVMPSSKTEAAIGYSQAMANLNRERLTKLERAEVFVELDAALSAMDVGARHGGDRRSQSVRAAREKGIPILGIRKETAEKVGMSYTAYRLAIGIANALTPETKVRLRGTWLEDHQAGLQLLADQTPEMQEKVCDLLFADPVKAGSVADALYFIEHDELPEKSKAKFEDVHAHFKALSRPDKIALLKTQKKLILEVVRSEGWTA